MRHIRDIYHYNKGPLPNFESDIKSAFGELVGMAIFIFLALSGVQTSLKAPAEAEAEGRLTLMQIQTIAISFGMGITVALFTTAHVSGGILNPAVLLSLVLIGDINWQRGLFFFLAEMIGGIIGAYFAYFITSGDFLGQNVLNPIYTDAQGVFAEALFTCALSLVVLFVIVDKRLMADYAPIVIGITVFLCHTLCTAIDGTSINPARSFAAAIVTGSWSKQWIFWVGPLTGAVFAVIIYLAAKVLTEDSMLESMLNPTTDQPKVGGIGTKEHASESGQSNHNPSVNIDIHSSS
ncbi:Aquaporin PIP1-5 [Choanephora cucurbitarum]|uniref:Aquaporin PIP1-5 n=1 Tax=Choanephora cucurbitarum TaxID=101091 RepID=A0A1C7NNK3_9FUNG|nr:Aquaporin PIP1-5 [Choanephora cucurbitarum]